MYKYIVVADDEKYGIEKFILFDAAINHKDMADAMKRLRYPFVVSAGFVDEFLNCYGESMTLSLKSRGEDDTFMLHNVLDIDDKKIDFK